MNTIRSKRRFIQKLNTAVLLGEAQQFCCRFIGNIFVGKTEQKQTILCLKYNTILTSYLLNNCCMKSHLNSWYSGQSTKHYKHYSVILLSLLVWYCLSYDINMRQKLIQEHFAPISWILGHNCIYGVVALHHICQQLNVWNVRWRTGLGAGPVR